MFLPMKLLPQPRAISLISSSFTSDIGEFACWRPFLEGSLSMSSILIRYATVKLMFRAFYPSNNPEINHNCDRRIEHSQKALQLFRDS